MRSLPVVALLLACGAGWAADLGPELLTAARKGQTAAVEALIGKGASVESTDKNGRTPLMLAAEHGHATTVQALLAKGARPESRDKEGWTAYALAVVAQKDEVLKVLPAPAKIKLAVVTVLAPDNVYSSCFMPPPQLSSTVKSLQIEGRVLTGIRDAAASSKAPVELVPEGGDATLTVRVRPRFVCMQAQSTDKVSLGVDARVAYTGESAAVLEKSFGGGIKGLREQIVTSSAQYAVAFEDWAKKRGGEIYWAAVEALLRHPK